MNTTSQSKQASDRELVFSRVFDAPRALVYKAWTDPKLLAKWWGPNGFTTTTESMDVRTGGSWKHTMHGPDGTNYPNFKVYNEVVPNERMVYSHAGSREGCGTTVSFVSTVTFEDEGTDGKRTKVTLRMTFPDAEHMRTVIREYGAEQGAKQMLERLEAFLPTMDGEGSRPFTITRTFDAPLDVVWRAWTDPARLARWWGPKGVTSTMKTFELKPGGVWHCKLQGPGQPAMWGKYIYREVTPKSRLVFVVSFSDEAGNLTKHPMSPDWPLEILSAVEFAEHGGKTTINVMWSPINASELERKTFIDGAPSMQGGWTGTFDQFAEFLAANKE